MKIRICPDCGISNEQAEFGQTSPRCRSCALARKKALVRENSKRWVERHPDRAKARNQKFYAKNREREKKRAQKWRDENRDHIAAVGRAKRQTPEWKAWRREYRRLNRDRENALRRAQYAANPEPERARCRAYKEANKEKLAAKQSAWFKAHPEKNREYQALRRAREKMATPPWADKAKIAAIYAEAVRLTRETGIKHHVDHYYPLQSEVMCGLHVETNLRIITAVENQRKKNKVPLEMAA